MSIIDEQLDRLLRLANNERPNDIEELVDAVPAIIAQAREANELREIIAMDAPANADVPS